MVRKPGFFIIFLILFGVFLTGCPKRVVKLPPVEIPPARNPVERLLGAFSAAETLQTRASIRVITVRSGEEMNFLLNGFILFEKPDKLRILGYHPLGTALFDALYRNGEFFLLIPMQKRVYTGNISDFEDLLDKAGEVKMYAEKEDGNEIPTRIRIEIVEKETRLEFRLKDPTINSELPKDSFEWVTPEGVEVKPLTRLLREKRLR